MTKKKELENGVRRSKRQIGAEASPLELPVRRQPRKNPSKIVETAVGSENEEMAVDEEVDSGKAVEATEEMAREEEVDSGNYGKATEGVEEQPEKEADAEEQPINGEDEQTQQSETKVRRKRGPTKMRKLAQDAMAKVNVDFSIIGEHSGPGSVTLSSFLGPLVREHVPVLVDDWRKVDGATKDRMWELIQARFNLNEGSQRESVFEQMGSIWRASKSRLVSDLRKTKTPAGRLRLKPSNIQSLASWNNWVKIRTSTSFKVTSEKYRGLRKSQIPHTTSRKGMFRLAMEMKQKSADPRKVTRSKVWLAGHTHSDGRPVKNEFADKIDMIRSIDSQMDSTSTENIREDAVTQVLGKDRYGRVRGMGRGISLTKLDYLNARDSHVQKLEASQAEMMTKIEELQNQIRSLAEKKSPCADGDAQSNVSNKSTEPVKCKILDWYSVADEVVGEGEFCSAEPSYKIGQIPIGPNAAAVIVKSATTPDAYLWRPTLAVSSIGEAIGTKIPWPADRIVLESPDCSSSGVKPAGSTDTSESQTTCNIYAWNGSDIVAEGKICSVDPSEKVNGIMLGPNAAIMKIEKVIDEKAFLWRPSPEMAEMGDAIHMSIAWPVDKISFISRLVDSHKTSPAGISKSTCSSKSANKKCILYDCIGSGKIVAEGRVLSTNLADLVHFVPIGPNASKVLVDLSKIGDAKVWRPNSEIECIDDATGSVLAWPNDKLKLV